MKKKKKGKNITESDFIYYKFEDSIFLQVNQSDLFFIF
jgi:hypothetical protein